MALFTAQLLYVEGILLFDNQNISVEWPDADTDVDTIPGGAAGVSPGPDKCSITVTNAIRKEGVDFKFLDAKLNRTEIECKAQRIGDTKAVKGMFLVREYTMSGGVGEATTEQVRLQSVGPVPKLE